MNDNNNLLYADPKEKNGDWQHLVEYCLDLYDNIEKSEYRKKKIEEIKESHKAYNQRADKKTFPWKDCSNIVMPLTCITVDNLEPRLAAGKIDRKPIVRLNMLGMTKKDQPTEIIEDWFNSEMQDKMDIEDVLRTAIHKQLLEGTVYPELEYSCDEKMYRDFQFDVNGNIAMDQNGPIIEDKVRIASEGVKPAFIPFTDIYVSDDVEDWETADVLVKKRPTYADLMRSKDKSGYMNIGPWLIKDQDAPEVTERNPDPIMNIDNARRASKETIECLECYVSYIYRKENENEEDATNFSEENLIATIAVKSRLLIRLRLLRDVNFKNEKLIKRIRFFREYGKSYGTTLYGKLKSLQKGSSDLFNLLIDVATVIMIPWFVYSNKTGLPKDFKIAPGVGIECDDPASISFPRFNVDLLACLKGLEIMTSFWERLSSIGDLQIGRPDMNTKTATETMAVIQEGNIKHNYQSKVSEKEFLAMFRTIYDLYYQNLPANFQFIYQGQPTSLPRAFMARDYKFGLTGSTELANKMIERQQNEALYGLTSQNPLVDPTKPLMEVLKSYNVQDADEWIKPEVAQVLQAMLENPEIPDVIKQHLQQKLEMAKIVQEREGMTREQQHNEMARSARMAGGTMEPQPQQPMGAPGA